MNIHAQFADVLEEKIRSNNPQAQVLQLPKEADMATIEVTLKQQFQVMVEVGSDGVSVFRNDQISTDDRISYVEWEHRNFLTRYASC